MFDCFIRVYQLLYPSHKGYQTLRKAVYMSWMSMCPSKPTLGYTTVIIIIIMMTVYRFTDCHNVTYTSQTEVVDSNTSLSLQTPAVKFTVENKTVSMLHVQCTMTCILIYPNADCSLPWRANKINDYAI